MGQYVSDMIVGFDTPINGVPRLAFGKGKSSPGLHEPLDLGDPYDATDRTAFLAVIHEAAESYSAFAIAVQSTYPDAASVIGSSAWSPAERVALHASCKAMADLFGV
jgi:hypothetical protein